MIRELRDRKNVTEVEEQLDRQHLIRLPRAGPQNARRCLCYRHAPILYKGWPKGGDPAEDSEGRENCALLEPDICLESTSMQPRCIIGQNGAVNRCTHWLFWPILLAITTA